jgi:hypothetical protein
MIKLPNDRLFDHIPVFPAMFDLKTGKLNSLHFQILIFAQSHLVPMANPLPLF